jgi:hypothetical protein
MKCNWSHVDLGWRSGDIYTMSKEAVEIAKLLDTNVSFLFNGVRVNVSTKTDPASVAKLATIAVQEGLPSVHGQGC